MPKTRQALPQDSAITPCLARLCSLTSSPTSPRASRRGVPPPFLFLFFFFFFNVVACVQLLSLRNPKWLMKHEHHTKTSCEGGTNHQKNKTSIYFLAFLLKQTKPGQRGTASFGYELDTRYWEIPLPFPDTKGLADGSKSYSSPPNVGS